MQILRETVTPGTAGYVSPVLGGKLCSVAYREASGNAGATVTVRGREGDSIDVIPASGTGLVRKVELNQVIITGNGSEVIVDARTEPEYIDPRYLSVNFPAVLPVSGTVGVNNFPATQAVSGSVGVSNFPSSQTVNGSIGVNNFPSPVPYAGGVAAPITGIWRGYAVASADGAVEITVGGVVANLGTASAVGQSFAFTLGVVAGDTVTLTNCAIAGGMIQP